MEEEPIMKLTFPVKLRERSFLAFISMVFFIPSLMMLIISGLIISGGNENDEIFYILLIIFSILCVMSTTLWPRGKMVVNIYSDYIEHLNDFALFIFWPKDLVKNRFTDMVNVEFFTETEMIEYYVDGKKYQISLWGFDKKEIMAILNYFKEKGIEIRDLAY